MKEVREIDYPYDLYPHTAIEMFLVGVSFVPSIFRRMFPSWPVGRMFPSWPVGRMFSSWPVGRMFPSWPVGSSDPLR